MPPEPPATMIVEVEKHGPPTEAEFLRSKVAGLEAELQSAKSRARRSSGGGTESFVTGALFGSMF